MAEEKKDKQRKTPKKKKSKILLFLASLFSVLLVLVIAAGLLLGVVAGTEEGRASVFRYFSAALLNAQGVSATYAKISSPNLREWRLEGVDFFRNGQKVLRVDAVDMRLSYVAVLKGTVAVEAFLAQGMGVADQNAPEALIKASGQAGVVTKLAVTAKALPLSLVMAVLGKPLSEEGEGVLDAEMAIDGSNVAVKNLSVVLREGGSLEAQGRVSSTAFDMRVKGKNLPTQLLISETGSVAPGKVTASVHAQGSFADPSLSGTFSYDTRLHYGGDKSVPVSVAAKMETVESVLSVRAEVTRSKSSAGSVEVDVPLKPYLAYFKKGGAVPLDFMARGKLDVAALGFLFDPAINTVQGQFGADVKVAGTLAAPVVRGEVRFEKGRYRNALTGTDLHQIDVLLTADDTGAVVKKATATDGGKGRISLDGGARWKEGAPIVDLALKVHQANLLKRPDMNGRVTGGLTLAGDARRLDLAGTLDVSPLTVMLESALLAEIPEIKVVDVAQGAQKKDEPSAFAKMLPAVHLNVTVKADRQAFLRGRGMDVELAGKVTVTGTLAEPVYNGAFKTLRGECSVLGKRFVLKKGEVRFEEGKMYLDVTALHRAKGLQVQADLSGALEKLNVKLSSLPPVPQDEILSRLLFDTSTKNISPLQAARLALALKQMKDGGSTIFDPVITVRQSLGLDQLNIGADETGSGQGVSIGAGKYIGDKIYLEVEKTPDPANPWKASAEIEVNDNLSIETTTGASPGSQGVGIQWKRDY